MSAQIKILKDENGNQVLPKTISTAVYMTSSLEDETPISVNEAIENTVGKKTLEGGEIFNNYNENVASGAYSHAEGLGTIASSNNQHVEGKYNIEDNAYTYAHILGNGNSSTRSNAHTIDWFGNGWFAGNVSVGEESKQLATEEYALNVANTVKDNLLNGAGDAYDTLKELGDLINNNWTAIEALREIASSKATIADLTAHIQTTNNPHQVTASQVNALALSGTFTGDIDATNISTGVYVLNGYNGTNYGLPTNLYGTFIQSPGSYKVQLVYAASGSNYPKFYLRRWIVTSVKWSSWSTFITSAEADEKYLTKTDANTTYVTNTIASGAYVAKSGDTMTGNLVVSQNTGSSVSLRARHPDIDTYVALLNNSDGTYRGLYAKDAAGQEGYIIAHDNSRALRVGVSTTLFDKVCLGSTAVYVDKIGANGGGQNVLYGAAWNDYAEFRISDCNEPGRVICENGDDTLSLATERLQSGANVVSDTFGFAIGQTENAQTPIAVCGRVLVYPYEDRNSYTPGDAVCAAPNGTVSKMTREEIREYPERIIGTVSAIPNYEIWGEGNVPVNGRIWIKVK